MQAVRNNKQAVFKNSAPLTGCVTKINNTQVYNAIDLDVVMAMYNVIEHSNNYSVVTRSLCQYQKDVTRNPIANSISLQFKKNSLDNTQTFKNTEIAVPLKYLSNFWRALEMPLINCEINLILSW